LIFKEKMIQQVQTDQAPLPGGHYSQATIFNGMIFVAGQLPIAPGQTGAVPESIEDQPRPVFQNIQAVLLAAGSDLQHVLQATIFISDIKLWGRVNALYTEAFGMAKPARAIVPVKELHYGCKIEMTVIAAQRQEGA
jgi:2-iminobutanoate/2-iminopropanoate deaminase